MKKYLLSLITAFACLAPAAFLHSQVYSPFAQKAVQPPSIIKQAPPVSVSFKPVYTADKNPAITLMSNTQDAITRSRINCLPRSAPQTIVLNAERENNFLATLKWETKYAFTASGFNIERSLQDTLHFLPVNFVAASTAKAVKKNYHLPDQNSYTGISYYRIKQHNGDTAFIYSNIVSIKGAQNIPLNIYPTPATNKVLINVSPPQSGCLTIMVFNAAGKPVQQVLTMGTKNVTVQQSLNISNLASGLYQVRISMPDKTFITGKFIKQ